MYGPSLGDSVYLKEQSKSRTYVLLKNQELISLNWCVDYFVLPVYPFTRTIQKKKMLCMYCAVRN